MTHDPILKQAIKEIKEVMDKYKCGGTIAIASQDYAEFKLVLPSWSAAQYTDQSESAVRIKAKGGKGHDRLTETLHMLLSCRDICKNFIAVINTILAMVSEYVDVDHHNQFEEGEIKGKPLSTEEVRKV